MRLILLRHGETDWNALDRYQGGTDVDLNATGERQARAAAAGPVGELLADAGELVAVCSPLTRARRTAQIVLAATVGAMDLAVDPALVELGGGDWEGRELSEIARRWPAEHRAWRVVPDLDAGPVGGEVLRVGGQRVVDALRTHVPAGWERADASEPVRRAVRVPDRAAEDDAGRGPGPRTLLVVAHGAVLRAAAGLLLGHEGEAFARLPRIGNARAVVLEGRFGQWRLSGYDV